jgi:hypothetical protein
MPERMPVIKRILNCCQVGVAVKSPGHHLLRGNEDSSRVSGSRETAGKSSISIGRMGGLRG